MTIEEITPQWLSNALALRVPGVIVTQASIEAVIQGTVTKVRVRACYNHVGTDAGLPPTFVVKGGFSSHRAMMFPIYELEMRFYRDLASRLDLRVPACLFAQSDPAGGQAIVILEDLDARCARFCRVQTPLSFHQAQQQLSAQARLHARWWESSEWQPGGGLAWIEALDPLPEGAAGVYQRGQLRDETYAACMALPRGVAVAKIFHDRDRMERALERLRIVDRQGPHCILHGDFHLGNLYIEKDGAAGVLDWQSTRRGLWAHDVTYFLVSALDMVDRRTWEKPLLEYYLEQLSLHGAPILKFADAWEAYKAQIVYGLYYWLVNPIEFQAELNNCAVVPRFALAALDHGVFA